MGSCNSLQYKIFVMDMSRNLGEKEYKSYRLFSKNYCSQSSLKQSLTHLTKV